jgi:NPCBM/NEW2 domain
MSIATPLLAALALTAGADLQTLSGKKVSGELVGLDRQQVVVRAASGDAVRVPITDVVQVDLMPGDIPPKGAHTAVELTDGSVLLCSKVEVAGDAFDLTVIPDLHVKVPTTSVFTVLRDAHDPKVRQDWQDFLTKRGRLDMVVVRSDGKLNGLEGTFGPGSGDSIEFTPSATGQKRAVKLARAQGLIFVQKPNPDAPNPLCRVTDAVGNLLVAADVVLNADGLAVTTVSGVHVAIKEAKLLAKLDFSKGKLAFLSDLAPTRDAVTLATEDDDLYARFVRFRKDLNLDNGAIRLGGKQFAKGVTLHAGTQLTYDVGGDYKELRATLGVDDGVETDSPVEVVVEGDGRELFRGKVSRKDPPRPVAVDVRGVRDLRVSVRATGLLDFGAQATLADAKVSK